MSESNVSAGLCSQTKAVEENLFQALLSASGIISSP